jgi:hypothetical protein
MFLESCSKLHFKRKNNLFLSPTKSIHKKGKILRTYKKYFFPTVALTTKYHSKVIDKNCYFSMTVNAKIL